MRTSPKLIVPATALLLAVGGGFAYTQYKKLHPAAHVAAGTPLPAESTATIAVLPGQGDGLGQTVTTSDNLLPSTASITLPQPEEATAAPEVVKPAVFDPTAARLGTTISLLLNAWPSGGPLPRQLAAAASELAEQTGQPAVAHAARDLRSSTPREGPLTLQVLLLETSAVVTLPPPDDLPQNDAQAEAEKSWFRKQLEKLVNISSTPSTQNRWVTAILAMQQQLVRGAVNDARASLEKAPLENDPRLEPLRQLVNNYLTQTARLNNLVTAYTNTFLKVKDDE